MNGCRVAIVILNPDCALVVVRGLASDSHLAATMTHTIDIDKPAG